ncbi:7545_t:CDS:2 [Dentiscutata erythropus]|uniref:7545_t:CDS:1 n=1 Tax=Dentiscutata erythropus TaxID=1348616 RepID=A0A9N9DX34_9GLOM|nr:7545_t:CDS:2 [Dentiscutata erythropus]
MGEYQTNFYKAIEKADEVHQHIIDDGVFLIIEEKLNGEDSVYTLSTEILTEESTQEISRGLKVVEEAGYSILVKVGVPEIPALPKSKTEDISSSVTEEPADNELKSIESGPKKLNIRNKLAYNKNMKMR